MLVRACLVVAIAALTCAAADEPKVDFRNFDYRWETPQSGVPDTWSWLGGEPTAIVHVVDGRYEFPDPAWMPPSPQKQSIEVSDVVYGDLEGNGAEDAAVDLIYSTGGTAHWHYLYVFRLAKEGPKLLARLQSGSRADGGLVKTAIEGKILLLDFADTNRRVADCCSEGYVRVRYRWQGGRFVETGDRDYGDLK